MKGNSNCCDDKVWENGFCEGCGQPAEIRKFDCEICQDTGEVSTDEDDGEGHIQRGVGTQKCECRFNDEN